MGRTTFLLLRKFTAKCEYNAHQFDPNAVESECFSNLCRTNFTIVQCKIVYETYIPTHSTKWWRLILCVMTCCFSIAVSVSTTGMKWNVCVHSHF